MGEQIDSRRPIAAEAAAAAKDWTLVEVRRMNVASILFAPSSLRGEWRHQVQDLKLELEFQGLENNAF